MTVGTLIDELQQHFDGDPIVSGKVVVVILNPEKHKGKKK